MSAELLASHGLYPKRPEVIDSSMLKDYVDCPSFFYLRHILGLTKKFSTENSKFDWGTCWHAVQEFFWNQISEGVSLNDAKIATLAVIQSIFPIRTYPDNGTDKHGRTKARFIKIFFDYCDEKVPEIMEEFELIRAEQFFDVYDDEIDLRWCGLIDKIRRRTRNGSLVIWDYKTTSSMGQYYFEQHEFGFQFPGYSWASEGIMGERISEVVCDLTYTLKASHQFYRRTFRYTPLKIAEWLKNVKMVREEMEFRMENYLFEPDKWVKNWNHCTKYGLCQFADVHYIEPQGQTRLRILENDYREERWDPMRVTEIKEVA